LEAVTIQTSSGVNVTVKLTKVQRWCLYQFKQKLKITEQNCKGDSFFKLAKYASEHWYYKETKNSFIDKDRVVQKGSIIKLFDSYHVSIGVGKQSVNIKDDILSLVKVAQFKKSESTLLQNTCTLLNQTDIDDVVDLELGMIKSYLSNKYDTDKLLMKHYNAEYSIPMAFTMDISDKISNFIPVVESDITLVLKEKIEIKLMHSCRKYDICKAGILKKNGRKVLSIIGCKIGKEVFSCKPFEYLLPQKGRGSRYINQEALVLHAGYSKVEYDGQKAILKIPVAEHRILQEMKVYFVLIVEC
jgi:hypothetical protein